MGKIVKRIISVTAFVLTLAVVLGYVMSVLSWKNGYGLKSWDNFYELKDTQVDVLTFGSSHNMCSINYGIWYRDYGIAGLSASGISLGMRSTYYFIKEALNYQKPEVILLEVVYTVWDDVDYTSQEEAMALNYSQTRNELIDSLYEDESDRMNYKLKFPMYHNRYWELTREDFEGFNDYSMGYYGTFNFYTDGKPNFYENVEPIAIDASKEEYLRMIIEMVKREGINLVLYVAPYNMQCPEEEWAQLDYVEQIAREYNVPMLNFNKMTDELGIDFAMDYADTHHLNVFGGEKLTAYLGEYLTENYNIPDRRGEKGYEKWVTCYEYYVRDKAMYTLKWTPYMGDYLPYLNDRDYIVAVAFKGEDYMNVFMEEMYQGFELLGLDRTMVDSLIDGIVVVENGNILYNSLENQEVWCYDNYGADIWVRDGVLIAEGYDIIGEDNGIYILVYDKVKQETADSVMFSPYNGFYK